MSENFNKRTLPKMGNTTDTSTENLGKNHEDICDLNQPKSARTTHSHMAKAFDEYVKRIQKNLKTAENGDKIQQNSSLSQEKFGDFKKMRTSSSFTIEAILGLKSKHEQNIQGQQQQKKSYSAPVHLNFMDVLSGIRRQRVKVDDTLEKMTECKLCGGCSFSQSKAVAANFMAQHLYTHIPFPIYSCLLCPDYHSSWKPRVQNHIKTTHPYINKNKHICRFIRDHRLQLDPYLCTVAMRYYGLKG